MREKKCSLSASTTYGLWWVRRKCSCPIVVFKPQERVKLLFSCGPDGITSENRRSFVVPLFHFWSAYYYVRSKPLRLPAGWTLRSVSVFKWGAKLNPTSCFQGDQPTLIRANPRCMLLGLAREQDKLDVAYIDLSNAFDMTRRKLAFKGNYGTTWCRLVPDVRASFI